MGKIKHTFFQRLFHGLWTLFLNGLFTVLPLTLTIALFTFSFRLIKNWLKPIQLVAEKTVIAKIPHFEIILIVLFIFVVGTIMKMFVFQRIVSSLEAIISRIPLIRPVYSGIKQLVDAFNFKNEKMTIKQVIITEFPRKGIYSIGFLTGELPQELSPEKNKSYFNVFVPTTPNPTTGFFLIIPEDEITNIHLTRQEAMALIISGGIIIPERFEVKK